ncbi:MAG: hypothetical protein L0H94_00285 [Nitrospira sp.]|nr:hypothetical protein [Nitrospira sp.]
MMGCAALVWTADELRVMTSSSEFRHRFAIAPGERYGLRLSSDDAGLLYLRTINDRQPFWVSFDRGSNFEPVPVIPAEHFPISAYNYKVHPASGVISALGRDVLWIYTVTTSQWQPRELPSDVHVRDVSLDRQQGLWCAGSIDSRRIPGEETEAAMRYQPAPGASFQPRSLSLSPLDAVGVIKEGGLAELRTVDAESEPVVATSICSWLLDDSSSFIFTLVQKRTDVRRLKGEMICNIDRSQLSMLRVFTHQGSVWQGSGNVWKQYSIVAPIVKALTISRRQILIRGLDVRRDKIAAAVEVSPPGVGDIAQEPEFTAVCISVDGGMSFQVTHRLAFKIGGEFQAVAWLN